VPLQDYGIIPDGNPWISTAYTSILKGVGLSLTSVTHGFNSWSNPSGGDGVIPAPPHVKTVQGPEKPLWKKTQGAQITCTRLQTPYHWSTSLVDYINRFL